MARRAKVARERPAIGEGPMNVSERISRRGILLKAGLLLNGAAGIVLAVPILRYLLAPLMGKTGTASGAWLSLGSLDQFPAGETRLATFRNPVVYPADGATANIPCWV